LMDDGPPAVMSGKTWCGRAVLGCTEAPSGDVEADQVRVESRLISGGGGLPGLSECAGAVGVGADPDGAWVGVAAAPAGPLR